LLAAQDGMELQAFVAVVKEQIVGVAVIRREEVSYSYYNLFYSLGMSYPSSMDERLRRPLCNQKIAGSNPASGHLATHFRKEI